MSMSRKDLTNVMDSRLVTLQEQLDNILSSQAMVLAGMPTRQRKKYCKLLQRVLQSFIIRMLVLIYRATSPTLKQYQSKLRMFLTAVHWLVVKLLAVDSRQMKACKNSTISMV